MQDDNLQDGQQDDFREGIFSSSYKPSDDHQNRDKLLSRQIKARINQQQSAEEYARMRLENAYSEARQREKLEQDKSEKNVSNSYAHIEIPSNQKVDEGLESAKLNQSAQADRAVSEATNDFESEHSEFNNQEDEIQNTNYHKRESVSTFDAKKYHQAWQNYYKTYFGRYYQSYYQNYHQQLADHHQRLQAQMKMLEEKAKNGTATQEEIDEITRIKQEIINNVKLKAKKVKAHDHFWPSIVAASVLLFLLFFQYNPIIVGAARQYLKPGDSASIPTIVAPDSDAEISQDPTISIPKIGVQAPVQYDVKGLYDSDVQPALENGVVRYNFPGNVYPGQKGNYVLIGHSSNNVFNPGKYNYIFVNLNKLVIDDIIVVNYEGVRYTYKVTATEVVSPTEFKYIDDPTDESVITLMTCAPPGTNRSRLFVRAKQISPDPGTNQEKTEDQAEGDQNDNNKSSSQSQVLPGTAPSIWDRLNGLFD
jgi:LPXTG-site transpeptidase (sortase) family protein